MRKSKKWILVSLVLALAIAWNIDCKKDSTNIEWTEPPPYFKHQINEFLDKIIDRILQGIPNNDDHYFSIKAVFNDSQTRWAKMITAEEKILINKRLILMAENEAEIASIIAHEVAHVVAPDMLPQSLWPRGFVGYGYGKIYTFGSSFVTVRNRCYRSFLFCFKHKLIDQTGIELMARARYNTYCSVDILRRIFIEEYEGKKVEEIEGERIKIIRKNAQRYLKKDQKKWILFAPEDLKKIKEICRKFEKQNGE